MIYVNSTLSTMSSKTRKTFSYGMILFSLLDDNEIHYCLVKHSLGYGVREIIMNAFTDMSFAEISISERDALLSLCSLFDNWEFYFAELWCLSQTGFSIYSTKYHKALQEFVKNRFLIMHKLQWASSLCPHGTWSLPKGHRESGETEFVCALRETREETQINNIVLIQHPPLLETYKKWHYHYYLGYVDKALAHTKVTDTREVSAVAWCTLSEAITLFPKDADDRVKMLQEVDAMLREHLNHLVQ
jgi:ADP-ribose pyrophosphatase YjhB (NUDIX family)